MKKFTFALKWREILKSYQTDIRREVYEAIIEYAATGEIMDMQPVSRMAFDFIRYELDEKTRRKEERLAKKSGGKETGKEKSLVKKSGVVSKDKATDSNKTPDINQITDNYYHNYTPPQPFEINRGAMRASITADKIRAFVMRCALDMIEVGKKPENNSDFYSELEYIVSNRIGFVHHLLSQHSPNESLSPEAWGKIFLAARTRFAA